MKNYIKVLLFIFVLPLAVSSCDDDDENSGAALIGTWEQVSFTAAGCLDSDDNETETCSSSCERIIITENTITFEGQTTSESYTATGSTITITDASGSDTVNYTLSGTTLTISYKDDASDGGCSVTIVFNKV